MRRPAALDSSLVARPASRPSTPFGLRSPSYPARHSARLANVPEGSKRTAARNYAYASTGNEWHFEKDGVTHLVRVNATLRANNGDVLRTASLAGHGIILQPEFLVGEDIRAGRLVTLLADYAHTPISMYAHLSHRRFLSPKVRSFVEHLEDRFGTPPVPAPRAARQSSPQPLESYP